MVTKLKNLNCNKTQKLELGQNSTQSLTNYKKTQTVSKFNNSNCDKTQPLKCDKTQKFKL